MKSTPITQRAATKYGSAPKNQEVTVDAGGKNPARFERMSPIKQVENTDKEKVSKRTGQVQDQDGYLMDATEIKTQQPDIVNETIQKGGTGLDPLQKAEKSKGGGSDNPAWIAKMQGLLDKGYTIQDLANAKHGTVSGLTGLGLVEGRNKPSDYMSTTTQKGSESKEYEYKPVERGTQTFQIRDARRRDRNIKRSRRVMNRELKKYGENSQEYKSAKGAYDRFLRERELGINQAYTKDYNEKVKADANTQTQAEFEGGGTNNNASSGNGTSNISGRFSGKSLGQIENAINNAGKKPSLFTPGSSGLNIGNYQTDRTNKLSQFSFGGSNNLSSPTSSSATQTSNFNILTGDPDKAQLGSGVQKRGNVGRGYKMGGFGSKNKNK